MKQRNHRSSQAARGTNIRRGRGWTEGYPRRGTPPIHTGGVEQNTAPRMRLFITSPLPHSRARARKHVSHALSVTYGHWGTSMLKEARRAGLNHRTNKGGANHTRWPDTSARTVSALSHAPTPYPR